MRKKKDLVALLGIPLSAGMILFSSCDRIKKWGGEADKKTNQETCEKLIQYTDGTTPLYPKKGRGYLNYAWEDMKENPELAKIASARKIADLYRELNNGKDMRYDEVYKRPNWKFKNSRQN